MEGIRDFESSMDSSWDRALGSIRGSASDAVYTPAAQCRVPVVASHLRNMDPSEHRAQGRERHSCRTNAQQPAWDC